MIAEHRVEARHSAAWLTYIATERAARADYLTAVNRANRLYNRATPGGRDMFDRVERTVWTHYYAAGKRAWETYKHQSALEAGYLPVPPQTAHPAAITNAQPVLSFPPPTVASFTPRPGSDL